MNAKQENRVLPDDGVTQMVIIALRRIIRAVDLRSRFLVTRYGVTGPQLALLAELSAHDGVPVGQLARTMHLSQATVTGILDRLVKRGLVRRERSDEDRRRVHVWLAEEGRQLLAEAPPLLQEEFTDELSKLEDWEQTQILSAVQRVVVMLEAKHIQATPILTTGPVAATSERTEAFLGQEPEDTGGKSAGSDLAEHSEGTVP